MLFQMISPFATTVQSGKVTRNQKPQLKILKLCGKIGIHAIKHKSLKSAVFGKMLREELVQMGPCYVKVGQIMSCRSDLFPAYIIDELKELQDNVPPFPFSIAKKVFEEEFGQSMSEVFDQVDTVPIASASIGQVHVGCLKRSGKQVVIKFQRPELQETYMKEIVTIRDFLWKFNKVFPDKLLRDLVIVVEECVRALEYELDFRFEHTNALLCSSICNDIPYLTVPRVYSKLTSPKVIVMEYCPGIKINDVSRLNDDLVDKVQLSVNLLKMFVVMITKYGFLHADPHPGNLAIDELMKNIILYDYGIFEQYDATFRKVLFDLFVAIGFKDVQHILTIMLENDLITMNSGAKDLSSLDPMEYVTLTRLISIVLDYVDDVNVNSLKVKIDSNVFIDSNNLPFILNSKLMLLGKTFVTLEGVCKDLNPEFNYRDHIAEIGMDIISSELLFDKVAYDINSLIQKNNLNKTNNDKWIEKNANNMLLTKQFEQQSKFLIGLMFSTLLLHVL
jgi:predicted unusual protein kinase regulating ubiquinone biosynthesis (AarF/ABC1/UbiB family)